MRQYCSGGSRIWSSIQPLPGVCSSGWLRKNTNRPPGSSTRATSSMASSTASMCSNTRHATTASKRAGRRRAAPPPRTARRPARRPGGPPRRSGRRSGRCPTTVAAAVGQAPGRADPRPCPTSSTPATPAEPLVGQRQDLLGVLGVDPVGELPLPPLGDLAIVPAPGGSAVPEGSTMSSRYGTGATATVAADGRTPPAAARVAGRPDESRVGAGGGRLAAADRGLAACPVAVARRGVARVQHPASRLRQLHPPAGPRPGGSDRLPRHREGGRRVDRRQRAGAPAGSAARRDPDARRGGGAGAPAPRSGHRARRGGTGHLRTATSSTTRPSSSSTRRTPWPWS